MGACRWSDLSDGPFDRWLSGQARSHLAVVCVLPVTQALINHLGIKLTTMLTDFSGYLIFVVAVVLTLTFLIWGEHG